MKLMDGNRLGKGICDIYNLQNNHNSQEISVPHRNLK